MLVSSLASFFAIIPTTPLALAVSGAILAITVVFPFTLTYE